MAAIPPNNNLEGLISSLKDGIYGAYNKGVKYGRYLALQEYLERKESAQPKWISVEERLPEPDKNVLTLKNRKCVRIGYYSEDCEEWVINDMIAYDEDITHWMPLPSTEGIE